jgi:cytochrome P450
MSSPAAARYHARTNASSADTTGRLIMHTQTSQASAESNDDTGRPLSSLPGPAPWPLVGNLLQLDVSKLHLQLERWTETYGQTYRLRLGRRDALVISRADTIAAVLRERPGKWRRLETMERVIREVGAHGLFTAEGDDWRRQRRLVMTAFDPAHLKRYFTSMVRVTERLKSRLDRAAEAAQPLDLQKLLMQYTVDVTAGLAFGIDMNTLENADAPIQSHLDKVLPALMTRLFAPFPWWRHVRLPADRAFDRHLAIVHEAIGGFIRAARARLAADPGLAAHPDNLLDALVSARDDEGGLLSEADLAGNVLSILLAGEDTTANTVAWTLRLLHTHRDAWDELVRGVDSELGGDDMPRLFDVARGFDAIEDCVNESMRLRPVAPGNLLESNQDLVLEGIFVPRGTMLMCVMRVDPVDPRIVADAKAFRPQRWCDARTPSPQPGGDASRSLLKSSMPFGAGPRMCPGRYLAMLEMKMILATIARNFELVDVGTRDGREPAERLAFSMFPVGLRLIVKPRARPPAFDLRS